MTNTIPARIYPTTNYLATLRSHTYRWFCTSELELPFEPEWIWFYLSMYLLFLIPPFFLDPPQLRALGKQLIWGTVISGAVFVMFPTSLGFVRNLPEGPTLKSLYAGLFTADRPHNLVPSLHVLWSTTIALAVRDRAAGLWRWALPVWAACICVSTVLIHQHHLLDVATALALVGFVRRSANGADPSDRKDRQDVG